MAGLERGREGIAGSKLVPEHILLEADYHPSETRNIEVADGMQEPFVGLYTSPGVLGDRVMPRKKNLFAGDSFVVVAEVEQIGMTTENRVPETRIVAAEDGNIGYRRDRYCAQQVPFEQGLISMTDGSIAASAGYRRALRLAKACHAYPLTFLDGILRNNCGIKK